MSENRAKAKFPEERELTTAEKELVRAFRSNLHLVMTAAQTGRKAELQQLPRLVLQDYCQLLANLPGDQLAPEVAGQVAQPRREETNADRARVITEN